jgi:hypothetical protein
MLRLDTTRCFVSRASTETRRGSKEHISNHSVIYCIGGGFGLIRVATIQYVP